MKKFLVFLLALLVSVTASAQTVGQPIVTAPRPTALQILQASAGGTTWAPVTVGGDATAGASAGLFRVTGLQGTPVTSTAPTAYQVLAGAYGGGSWTPLSFSGDMTWSGVGTPLTTVSTIGGASLTAGLGSLSFRALNPGGGAQSSLITQASGSGTGITGSPFTVQAQSETGSSSVGGALNLSSGSGVYGNGAVNIQSGGTTLGSFLAGGAFQWASGYSAALSQASTSSATGANLTLTSQASTATNGTPGPLVLNVPAATGTGTPNRVLFQYGGNTYGAVGPMVGVPSYSALYLLPNTVAPSASNPSLTTDGASLYVNTPVSGGSLYFYTAFAAPYGAFINGAGLKLYSNTPQLLFDVGVTTPGIVAAAGNLLVKTVSTGTINTANPIIGSSADASPYGVHGDVAMAYGSAHTATAAEYAMQVWRIAPSAAFTLTVPAAAAGVAYTKDLIITSSAGAVTVTDGTHSPIVLPTTVGALYRLVVTSVGLTYK